jgi:TM2 domain-containing membrane protein YozV
MTANADNNKLGSQAQGATARFYPTFFLCIFLGFFGAHRFYVGKIGTGLLQLVACVGTCGVLGIWWLVDMIMILLGRFKDKDGVLIPNINPRLSWSVFAIVIVILGALTAGSLGNRVRAPVHSPVADHPAFTITPHPQRVAEGKAMRYSITVPDGWKVEQEQRYDYDLLMSAQNQTLCVGVIAEEANFGSIEAFVTNAQEYMRKVSADTATFSDVAPITIDNRTWRTFRVQCRLPNGTPTIQEVCVYTGPEGTFQVVGWTLSNLFDRNAGKLREVMHSFRFPEAQIK